MGINKCLLRVVPNVVGYRLRMDGRVLELSAEVFIASQSDVNAKLTMLSYFVDVMNLKLRGLFSTRPQKTM
jgi:hypothetical protein